MTHTISRAIYLFTIALIGLTALPSNYSLAQEASKPSDHFRKEHVTIQNHLQHLRAIIDELPKTGKEEKTKGMKTVVGYLKERIEPHAQWEEKYLYNAVDKRAGKESPVFTSTMRYDHKIIGRWIKTLSKETDARRFATVANRLLGLIAAHFEKEEEVLLPILDKAMTIEEFQMEIPSAHHEGA